MTYNGIFDGIDFDPAIVETIFGTNRVDQTLGLPRPAGMSNSLHVLLQQMARTRAEFRLENA